MPQTTTNRETYVNAYRRVKALERSMSERLRQDILVRYFGGCGCRLHNCLVNYENGFNEGPDHAKLAKLAKRYNYEQKRIWTVCGRLEDAFARRF